MKPPHSNRPDPRGYSGPRHNGPDRPPGSGGHEARPDRPNRDERKPDHHPARDAAGPGRDRPAGGQRQEQRGPAPRLGPAAPRGAIWLYGAHAVAAALANPARRLRRLLLTEEAEADITLRLRQPWPVPPERTERGRLDQLLGRETVHQGAALLADPLAPPVLAQVLERHGPLLVLDQVTDPRNVGAILRSAAAFGAAAVITQERNAPEETGALAKAASGALERVPLLRAVNLARTLVALKAGGCWVVGLDAGGGALSGPALAERRVALVLGSEGEGLRRLTRDTCDEIAGIAMPGGPHAGLDSLNVSAAATVALYELARRPA
jgi:23S rRNA (guanosine2251-2'-O)-methyltransferase